jgi:outer membrane receptor protein involved in Fe transport
MIKQILTSIFITILSINSFANNPIDSKKKGGEIKGVIKDAVSGNSVEYASVALYEFESKKIIEGGLSDSNGSFDFLKIKKGNYFIQVDFIGYKTYKSKKIFIGKGSKNIELGVIKLQPDVAIIADVTVTAERTYIENKIDKKVVNIGKDLLTAGASATDIMSNLPSVDVDIEGNVSLRGNSNVRILVDGRPTNMSSEDLLATIPAENIDKVEIITNPSAKYDPDGISGILNIILKKNKKLGFNGSASAGIGSANEFSGVNKYNGSLNLNYNKGKWNIFANYGYRNDERESGGDFTRKVIDVSGIKKDIIQESNSVRNRISNSLKTGFDYSFSDKNTFSYTANIRKSDRSRFEEIEYITSPTETRGSDRNYISSSLSHDVIFKHKLDDQTFYEINAYRLDSKQDANSIFDSTTGTTPKPTETDTNKGTDDLTTAQFDFTKDNDSYKLEFGVKAHARNIDSDYQYFTTPPTIDPNKSNHFLFSEQIYSAYSNYGKKWEKWSLQAGLRIEQAFTESKLINETPYENNYFNFYPSVFFVRKIGKRNEIGFSYSKRVSRPSTRQLNPAKIYSDELNIRMGNPMLNPEFTNSLETSYTKYWKGGSFSSAIFYRHTTDKIQRIKLVDSTGVSTSTYDNIATAQEFGFEASVMTKLYDWWSINASTNLYYSILDTDDPNFSNNGVNWFTRLNNTFKLSPTWSVQASGMYMAKRVIAQGHIDPMYKADLGIKKTIFNKRGSIGFRVSDVFNSFNFTYYTDGTGFEEVGNRNWESRVAYITFSYNFGEAQRKKRKAKREGGEGEDSDASF